MANSAKLTPRLEVITEFAKGCKNAADIGCDHGKVSVHLAKQGARVYAVDISAPSLEKARKLAQNEGVQEKIDFYCSDGLENITDKNVDCIIIAGMGWRTIAAIIENNYEFVKKIDRLIIQPMDSVPELRIYLIDNSFEITNEKLVWDDGRLYTVIAAKHGKPKKLKQAEIILGPKIIKKNDILLEDLIKKELKKRKDVLIGLKKTNINRRMRIAQIKKEIRAIKGALR